MENKSVLKKIGMFGAQTLGRHSDPVFVTLSDCKWRKKDAKLWLAARIVEAFLLRSKSTITKELFDEYYFLLIHSLGRRLPEFFGLFNFIYYFFFLKFLKLWEKLWENVGEENEWICTLVSQRKRIRQGQGSIQIGNLIKIFKIFFWKL